MADKQIKSIIQASGHEITVLSSANEDDYISLSDIARYRNAQYPSDVIQNWMRLRSTVEYLGLWERLHNPNFNYLEFEVIDAEAGHNSFVLTPKRWIESTGAIGIISKQGRYASTFAHSDIAFKFAAWISVEFELYIIKDYQRLKGDEQHRHAIDWNVKRLLAKANYRIHTDAIKENLIPNDLPKNQQGFVYADEADVLNVALFGITAKQWRDDNPNTDGNIRDHASIEQLIVMANLENANALFIQQGMSQHERLRTLRDLAVTQLQKFSGLKSVERMSELHNRHSPSTDK